MIEEPVAEETELIENFNEEMVVDETISLHALSGVEVPNTIRLKGEVGKKELIVFLNSGSTHSFLDLTAAKEI